MSNCLRYKRKTACKKKSQTTFPTPTPLAVNSDDGDHHHFDDGGDDDHHSDDGGDDDHHSDDGGDDDHLEELQLHTMYQNQNQNVTSLNPVVVIVESAGSSGKQESSVDLNFLFSNECGTLSAQHLVLQTGLGRSNCWGNCWSCFCSMLVHRIFLQKSTLLSLL